MRCKPAAPVRTACSGVSVVVGCLSVCWSLLLHACHGAVRVPAQVHHVLSRLARCWHEPPRKLSRAAIHAAATPAASVAASLLHRGAFPSSALCDMLLPTTAEESTNRQYALKRMRKSAVVQCPEHVFCEQAITKNVAHPFCIRQYASFQVRWLRGPCPSCRVSWVSWINVLSKPSDRSIMRTKFGRGAAALASDMAPHLVWLSSGGTEHWERAT